VHIPQAYTNFNIQVILGHFVNNQRSNLLLVVTLVADPSGRAVEEVAVRPFGRWNSGFESRRGHGCLSIGSVVYSQVEVSATS